jgi:WD40 repeat protein
MVASKPLAAWNVSRYEVPTDFYSHPLDWSAKDQIAVTLNSELVYANPMNHSLTFSRCPVGDTSCVKFSVNGDTIALGSLIGPIRLLDAERDSPISTHDVSQSCVHCIGYHGTLILSGHHDGCVNVCDTREPLKVEAIRAHSLTCCTVLFDHEAVRFATGSDDCLCLVWDIRNTSKPSAALSGHAAAVRGISWCPRAANKIATGGGSHCRRLKLWDTDAKNVIAEINTGSQVCNVFWLRDYSEILTTEGFHNCTMTFWSEADLKITATIREHTDRVLYCAPSPIQKLAATLTPKDGLRIWSLAKADEMDPPKAPIR